MSSPWAGWSWTVLLFNPDYPGDAAFARTVILNAGIAPLTFPG